jgi:hypothetical protein
VTLFGAKPFEVMSTAFVAANAGVSRSAGTATAITNSFFIGKPPSVLI